MRIPANHQHVSLFSQGEHTAASVSRPLPQRPPYHVEYDVGNASPPRTNNTTRPTNTANAQHKHHTRQLERRTPAERRTQPSRPLQRTRRPISRTNRPLDGESTLETNHSPLQHHNTRSTHAPTAQHERQLTQRDDGTEPSQPPSSRHGSSRHGSRRDDPPSGRVDPPRRRVDPPSQPLAPPTPTHSIDVRTHCTRRAPARSAQRRTAAASRPLQQTTRLPRRASQHRERQADPSGGRHRRSGG